ncbi:MULTISPECIES: MoaD/ThiS family protein [Sphingobacterium]|jgi:molybdopterin synthase sulfur carrier subunit|uniref:MoaD/ThiS family protein n=1 Tax=Sphingobacterium litopenaei TaxID=2763500 RepID=A0ABR7YD25_9SPHI|nr:MULTISPECIES: MoaD/ThiS family protein [Sphingobacterium]MBD1429209.1 MoaD/ThiS family protein [Sphingobacterium litopenaei]
MITLEFFAGLKDYFPPVMEVRETPEDINSLRRYLIDQQSFAKTLLEQCRFAIDDTFVQEDYPLRQGDLVLVIPPSSGG